MNMDKLKELGIDDEFGMYYDAEIVHRKEINSARSDGYNDGKQEGKREGRKDTATSIAKSMLAKKMELPLISELTGLSQKQIASIR